MNDRSTRLCLLVVFATTMVGAAASASPLVKREQSAPAKPKPPSISAELATATGQAYGTPISEAEMTSGIPKSLHAIFANAYNGDNLDRLVKKYASYARDFEARWAKLDQHRRAVDLAIKQANELAKAKNYRGAEAALLGVLTGISVDHDGKLEARKGILEEMDVELPALSELARVARDGNDPFILPDITVALYARRRLLDSKPAELLVWLAYHAARSQEAGDGSVLRAFSAGQVNTIGDALRHIDDVMYHLFKKDGMLIAQGFFHALKDYGLPTGEVFVRDSVKPGGYGLFDLIPSGAGATVKVTADSVIYKADITQRIPKNCHETDRIDGYDPVSRRFTYRTECDYDLRRTKASLKAKLRTPPPAWAMADDQRVWVIGKVKKQGLDWELVDAQVADFRFLGPMSQLDFGDAAAVMF